MDDSSARRLGIGAEFIKGTGTHFRVWAPKLRRPMLKVVTGAAAGVLPLTQEPNGYFSTTVADAAPGDRYIYLSDQGHELPDPASRFQPDGVHQPSQIVDPAEYRWHDRGWHGLPLEQYVIYELHVGTFSAAGTFSAIIPLLDYLKELGVTALELMPVAQFPGNRNWGYDGVYPFAPQSSYGGPNGLKELIDACHRKELCVIMDVVYNHLGPEGNYLGSFGHYFTDRYHTPWGEAINFDGPYSDHVCAYFIANALYWIHEYHVDALRLDAVHGIYDFSAKHILQQIAEAVCAYRERQGRLIHVIAESDLNDTRIITPVKEGGYGIDAQWSDDFHHALHTLLTGEKQGYYQDFRGLEHLSKALRESFVYSGQYSSYRNRRHGNSAAERPPSQFVVFAQNHDQIGNRMNGDRLSSGLSTAKLTLAAGMLLTSPYIPLIFMGEEYAETAPFQYFVSQSDPALVEAIRIGRREEFAAFCTDQEPPDPQDERTFLASKLDLDLRDQGQHRQILCLYRKLLQLRRSIPALHTFRRDKVDVLCWEAQNVLTMLREVQDSAVLCLYNFSEMDQLVTITSPAGRWEKILDTSSPQWGGQNPEGHESHSFESGPDCVACSIEICAFSMLIYEKSLGGSSHGT